ncbi:MAG: cysteine desulfurase [Pedobacter sp.]|nr:MAG: cysteine desulfurase [Pedobacter sp.]
MQSGIIYLDNNSTTPLDPRVLEAMMPYFTDFYGNASSAHLLGKRSKIAVENAREAVGDLINSNPEDIIFTAGATESINLAIRGVVKSSSFKVPHVITVKTEHPAVLDTCKDLESIGVEITYLDVEYDGLVNLSLLKESIRDNTILVCVMLVNNETGVIQQVKQIAEIAHEAGALFLSDATQAVGKIAIDVLDDEIDLLAFSAHKFYGPKGIGGLYVNSRLRLKPLIFGGGHERGLRSGTLNVPAIVGMGVAAKLASEEMDKDEERISALATLLKKELMNVDGVVANGSAIHRQYNTLNLCFKGVDNQDMLLRLDKICASNGSACHAMLIEPSHVLLAMGLTREQANSSLRFSLGRFNTEQEIETAIVTIKEVAASLKQAEIV